MGGTEIAEGGRGTKGSILKEENITDTESSVA